MTNLNPLTLLDTILSDYLSPRARRAVHSLILLVAVLVTVFLTAEGDWKAAVGSLIAAIYAAANKANTPPVVLAEPGEIEDDADDDLSYAESGGQPFPTDHDEASLYDEPLPITPDDHNGDPHRY